VGDEVGTGINDLIWFHPPMDNEQKTRNVVFINMELSIMTICQELLRSRETERPMALDGGGLLNSKKAINSISKVKSRHAGGGGNCRWEKPESKYKNKEKGEMEDWTVSSEQETESSARGRGGSDCARNNQRKQIRRRVLGKRSKLRAKKIHCQGRRSKQWESGLTNPTTTTNE
jgi:hypothetical protein